MLNLRFAGSLVACLTLTLGGIASSVAANNDDVTTPESLIPVFQRTETASDSIPAELNPVELGVPDGSEMRSLGSDSIGQYWVSLSPTSQVCLTMYIPGGYEVAGSTCGTLTEFNKKGLKLQINSNIDGELVSRVAYLFPSDVDMADLAPADHPVSRAATDVNFVAISPEQNADLEARAVPRSSGSEFQFRPLGG